MTTKVVLMADEKAMAKGANCAPVAKEMGKILGGGGGGNTHFAQAAGPLDDKKDEAVKRAKEMFIEQLTEGKQK